MSQSVLSAKSGWGEANICLKSRVGEARLRDNMGKLGVFEKGELTFDRHGAVLLIQVGMFLRPGKMRHLAKVGLECGTWGSRRDEPRAGITNALVPVEKFAGWPCSSTSLTAIEVVATTCPKKIKAIL